MLIFFFFFTDDAQICFDHSAILHLNFNFFVCDHKLLGFFCNWTIFTVFTVNLIFVMTAIRLSHDSILTFARPRSTDEQTNRGETDVLPLCCECTGFIYSFFF